MFVKIVVILKNHQFHLDGLADAHSLSGKRALPLHVIINRRPQGVKPFRVPDVFQVKHEVLAPADLHIHPKTVLLHQVAPIQLVPQNTVIKICGIFHHTGGKFLLRQHPVLLDVAFVRNPLSHHPVEIRNDQIAVLLLSRTHQKPGGIRRQPVVAVYKLQIFSPCQAHGPVSRIRHAGILLVNHPDSGISSGVLIANTSRHIRTAVIRQQKFKIRIFLI